jgi:hypothetical protein
MNIKKSQDTQRLGRELYWSLYQAFEAAEGNLTPREKCIIAHGAVVDLALSYGDGPDEPR